MPDSLEYKISVTNEAIKEILIALLSSEAANGFEEEKDVLKVFFLVGDCDEFSIEKIIQQNDLNYFKSIIKEENWNARWESDFKPVTIGKFCRIRASFHEPSKNVEHDIIITPKMSFGTGHHPTTQLMIEAMEKLEFKEKSVFDFGTGTGILSILADKSGAGNVTAIDNDEWSINNAFENFNLNNCHKILLFNNEQIPVNSIFDIILANINLNIILQNMGKMEQHLHSKGVLLLSGLLTGDEPVIIAEAQRKNLRLSAKSEMNGWICLRMVKG
jgi:ribosomal protein L11 methyltransferase